MKRSLPVILSVILLLAAGSVGYGQVGRQSGSLHGQVVDKEKVALPGATVTLSGPALMGTKSYLTAENGSFRFPLLGPGEYQVKAEMPNFQTVVMTGINISVGKTSEVTIEMETAKVAEQVTVVATAPVVDVQASKMSVNFSSQFLASIPMNRDLYDIQNAIPGSVAEGIDYRRMSSILGGTLRSNLYALDGVPMNDPAVNYSMANINVDVYDEIEFEMGAHPAEVGQTDSTYINIVTKSGSNKYSGGAVFYFTDKSLGENLFTPEQIKSLNVNPPEKFLGYKDLSLNFGGPIIKDRLWFFLNGRRQVWTQANPNTPEMRMINAGFTDPEKIKHYDVEHQEWLGFGKLTFQLTPNIKYMGMLHYNHIYEPVYQNSLGSDASFEYVRIWDHENTYTTTHQFNVILDQNTFVDVRGTYVRRFFPLHSMTPNDYTYYDNTAKVYWGAAGYNDEYIRKKTLGSVSITRFQDSFLGADHEFKAGAEFEQGEYHRDWWRENPYYSYWADWKTQNPYYSSTTAYRGRLRIRTSTPNKGMWDVQDHARRFSGFLQDSASFGRLTVNLGLRLDYSYAYEPEQSRPKLRYDAAPPQGNPALVAQYGPNYLIEALTLQAYADGQKYAPWDALTTPWKKPVEFTTLSPRLGLVYDVFGTGKTAVKLSYSRYFEPIWTSKYNGGQIFGAGSVYYNWTDTNRNKMMDLPGTDLYVVDSANGGYPNQDPLYSYYPSDLKAPYMDEFMAGIDQEVIKDFRVGLDFVYKVNKNIVEDFDEVNGYNPNATDANGLIWLPFSFIDPGWDNKFNTSDDQTMTVYGLRADRPAANMMGGNPPEAKREYWAAILSFDKRMSNKWQLKGSVLYSQFKGNCDPGYSATEGESTMFDNPNTLINGYGYMSYDRPLQIKIMGTYVLPLDFIVSAYFQYRSGSPWNRTIARVYFPANYMGYGVASSYYGVNAEESGARRGPSFTNLDLRIEKEFKVSSFGRVNVYVDIFNVAGRSGLNVNQDLATYLRYDQSPVVSTLSTTYAAITSIYGVRSIRLGARFSF
jgi:hypothetical protein